MRASKNVLEAYHGAFPDSQTPSKTLKIIDLAEEGSLGREGAPMDCRGFHCRLDCAGVGPENGDNINHVL